MRYILLVVCFAFSGIFVPNLSAQISHFQGTWTMIGTTYEFEFDLYLHHYETNRVTGHFDWKVVGFDEHDPTSKAYYQAKLGTTAKEFVRGFFDPETKQYFLKGYQKEDPHQIISTDLYRLKLDENGVISGDSKAHNTWKGRINGSAVKKDAT